MKELLSRDNLMKVKKAIKPASNVFYWFVLAVMIVIAGTAALSAIGLPKQLMLFVVQSGSMEPAIKTGSVVFVKPQADYKVGDIVTFKQSANADIKNPSLTITHRIAAVDDQGVFTTKGDANNIEDMNKLAKDMVLGRVLFGLPYLGYPVGFVKTQTGFILLVVVPATIFVYSELQNIKKEFRKLTKERKKRKLELEYEAQKTNQS